MNSDTTTMPLVIFLNGIGGVIDLGLGLLQTLNPHTALNFLHGKDTDAWILE